MKVQLTLLGVADGLAQKLADRVLRQWGDVAVLAPGGGEHGAHLVIRSGREAAAGGAGEPAAPMEEIADIEGLTFEEAWFQVNAKLGKLSHSGAISRARGQLLPRHPVTRRGLFTGLGAGPTSDPGVPVLEQAACEWQLGCRRCAAACPAGAVQARANSPAINAGSCTRCGICAAACPMGAIGVPALSDEALLGLLGAMDTTRAPAKTLVLTCRADYLPPDPWMVVEALPDVGLVGVRWLAMAALSTLGTVAVLCADEACAGRDHARHAAEAISGLLGDRAPRVIYAEGPGGRDLIRASHASGITQQRAQTVPGRGSGWERYAAAIAALALPGSPVAGLGFTALEASDGCTLCGACAECCPHRSLDITEQGTLRFSAASCTGCGRCTSTCPEHALTLSPAAGDITSIWRPVVVRQDTVIRCSGCGAPLAAAALLRRVSSLLGAGNPMISYCPQCKLAPPGAAAAGGPGPATATRAAEHTRERM